LAEMRSRSRTLKGTLHVITFTALLVLGLSWGAPLHPPATSDDDRLALCVNLASGHQSLTTSITNDLFNGSSVEAASGQVASTESPRSDVTTCDDRVGQAALGFRTSPAPRITALSTDPSTPPLKTAA
jgi:hypothetical protein